MTFDELLDHVRELLQQRGRVTYGALKRRFALDDGYLKDITAELIEAEQVARDEEGKVLVWVGEGSKGETAKDAERRTLHSELPAAERRQLTVMFCDLVGSTMLSAQLDPEELREVMQQYQEVCTTVIQRYAGYIAQHLGDGLLVYFGYPSAHEDDAQRAVRAGLEIIDALRESPLQHRQLPHPLQVRIGIHTGLVVIGEIGSSEKREMLALGETPNFAARVQGVAEPDTVVISAVTQRLVYGLFECQNLGPQALKGISVPVSIYQVLGENAAQSRFEVAVGVGLAPLVGREEELGLLQRRWAQAKEGAGQVVLLSGEAGIGKSRLVQTLKEQVLAEGVTRIEFRCSPYHPNSAFYPLIEHLQRLLQYEREDPPHAKLGKLQRMLAVYRFPQADTLPLMATLLSLPEPEGMPPLTLSPQKQKQKTQEALVAWLVEEAERQVVYCVWEDLHWVDPSTLEVLTLLLDQVPTTRLLTLLTFRPDFTPPWRPHSHVTQLTLSRLRRPQVEAMVERVTGGKALPAEVMEQIIGKTDGVPLFVEELTKTVLESEWLQETEDHYELTGALPPLAIPSTLQDSLMARLDRLSAVREIVQLGATLGREFSYELLHAVSPLDEGSLQQGLRQLVEAELIYQHGLPPQARYLFKHALIQDTAYQSLLRSTRRQYHREIAQVLIEQFSETVETQPELLAQHYTEAGLIEQALPYWQRAGDRATRRSAHQEATAHLTTGLALLKRIPDISERAQRELRLQLALGTALIATKGPAAPETEHAYARARALCGQVGETPWLFPVLGGLCSFYQQRGEFRTACELAEQLLRLAQSTQDPARVLWAHCALGVSLDYLGELVPARGHLEQSLAVYVRQPPRAPSAVQDPGVVCLCQLAHILFRLGYPDHALKRNQEALVLAQELSHAYSFATALSYMAGTHVLRREWQLTQARADAALTFAAEQEFPHFRALGTIHSGWALAQQGQREEGITRMRQGTAALAATEATARRSWIMVLLAEAYGEVDAIEEGLTVLAEALAAVDNTGERYYEAELYRLKGELRLQQLSVDSSQVSVAAPQAPSPHPHSEATACFLKAIEIARKQQAKSWELRAVMSLSRLWQQQGEKEEACRMLSEIYYWFTEGFDTKDLQEAKTLLAELTEES